MNLTRRKFFFFGLAAGVGLLLPDTNINWINIFKPTQKQIDFFNIPPHIPIHLYGIPYHQSNAGMGTWLGISRKGY